ncbi:MAG: leucine-rich repeat domain-containing protein [Eubacteriales bacterium]|nr:leucine-rich repeat domain-containing protein [Eubacteriales bacterium]
MIKNRLKIIFVSGITALCLSSVPAYGTEKFTAPETGEGSVTDIFSSGDKEQVEMHVSENKEDEIFTSEAVAPIPEEGTVIQNGIIYEKSGYAGGEWYVRGYTEELQEDSIISIPMYVEGRPVIGMIEGCFRGLGNVEAIELPESMRDFPQYTFAGCTSLLDIKLPSRISELPEYMFAECPALMRLELPENVKKIGQGAFQGASEMYYLYIPPSVTEIADDAMEGLKNLTVYGKENSYAEFYCKGHGIRFQVKPDEGTMIQNGIIYEKSGITGGELYVSGYTEELQGASKISIPMYVEGRLVIGMREGCFLGLENVEAIELPGSMRVFSKYTFAGCVSLSEVKLPSRINELPEYMFVECPALTKLELPDYVKKISQGAFQGAPNLEYLYIPPSVTEIADDAMEGLKKLTVYGKANSYAESYCKTHGISFEVKLGEGAVIQNGIIYEEDKYGLMIVSGYTEELRGISKISIPIFVEGKLVYEMAEGCFRGLENVEAIEIPGNVEVFPTEIFDNWDGITLFCSEGSSAYFSAVKEEITYDISTFPPSYFVDEAQNGITYVLDWKTMTYTAASLEWQNLSEPKVVVYKDEIAGYPVTSIDTGRFLGVYFDDDPFCFLNVKGIVIPDGIQELAKGEISYWLCLDADDGVIRPELGYVNLTSVVFEEGENPIKLHGGTFDTCTSLSEVKLSSRVRELPAYMFIDCPALTKLELPDGVEKIGQAALQGAANLKYLYIPSSVTEIADDAMDGLKKLTVYGKANSYAEYYCRLHGINFKVKGGTEQEKPYIASVKGKLKDHYLYFTIELLREMEGAKGYEYQVLKSDGKTVYRTKKVSAATCTLSKAPNDAYVRVRSWKTENGKKVYSNWSDKAHLYLKVSVGNMAIKKTAVKGRKVTLTFADSADFFKNRDGFDCYLQKTVSSGTTYSKKNQKNRSIIFTNIKPGTYTAKARAYRMVNGKKVYGNRSNTVKVVVK